MENLTNQTSLSPATQRTIFTIPEFVEQPEFDYLSRSSLQHLIFNSKPRKSASGNVIPGNGLVEAGAIIRIGRRVLLDAPRFRTWVEAQRESVASL